MFWGVQFEANFAGLGGSEVLGIDLELLHVNTVHEALFPAPRTFQQYFVFLLPVVDRNTLIILYKKESSIDGLFS